MEENNLKKSESENLSQFLNRTGNLLIHLLDKCNLHCKHCYLDASSNGRYKLPFHLVKRTLDEASVLGIRSVQFSGGEPLLYPDIHKLLRFTRGKTFSVTLSTNGTLIDDEIGRLCAEINANVVVSIDGPATYHDTFRGTKNCFVRVSDGVARLVNHGVAIKVLTTLCEDNVQYVDWCAEWAHKMKAVALTFQPLERIGRGHRIENKRLSEEMLYDLFLHLNDLAVFYISKGLKIKMSYQNREFMLAHPCTAFVCNGRKCHRGVEKELKKIVIREDGCILPELVDIDRQFSIGNLYTDTLENNLLAYLEDRYSDFDQLCRQVYNDTVLNYPSPLIPWNEILTERSRLFIRNSDKEKDKMSELHN